MVYKQYYNCCLPKLDVLPWPHKVSKWLQNEGNTSSEKSTEIYLRSWKIGQDIVYIMHLKCKEFAFQVSMEWTFDILLLQNNCFNWISERSRAQPRISLSPYIEGVISGINNCSDSSTILWPWPVEQLTLAELWLHLQDSAEIKIKCVLKPNKEMMGKRKSIGENRKLLQITYQLYDVYLQDVLVFKQNYKTICKEESGVKKGVGGLAPLIRPAATLFF